MVGRDAWVYFLQEEGEHGPIKVGWAYDVVHRMSEHQCGNPRALRLLGTCLGGEPRERELKAEWAEHRIRGEWYRPTDAVLAAIARATDEGDDWVARQEVAAFEDGMAYPPSKYPRRYTRAWLEYHRFPTGEYGAHAGEAAESGDSKGSSFEFLTDED